MDFKKGEKAGCIAVLLSWREGDELKFITRVELSPFTGTSTVEMSGFMLYTFFFFTSSSNPGSPTSNHFSQSVNY